MLKEPSTLPCLRVRTKARNRQSNLRSIIKIMARGWESKAVEEQIGAAEARKEVRRKRRLTPDETEQLKIKDALLLERARIVREMERAYMRRHLVMLERGLAYIDAELAKLEPKVPT